MKTLHTVNKSSFNNAAFRNCAEVCDDQDSILLIEDGVYCGLDNTAHNDIVSILINKNISIFAIGDDCVARGICEKLRHEILQINYSQFVELCITHQRTLSWY